MSAPKKLKLSLGPVLFNWTPDAWRDFYFQAADESPVADVYIGEVVCSKRQPFFDTLIPEVVDRLKRAKKNVIFSSLALVMNKREREATKELSTQTDFMVEANDMSAHGLLSGKPHMIGHCINVYNEATLEKLCVEGATRFCLPQELPGDSIYRLAEKASSLKAEIEVQAFGRIPLAISGRCYHARLHGLSKDSCQFVCAKDPDGKPLQTIDGDDFLVLNGVQTMSHTCLDLLPDLPRLTGQGVSVFRLSPHSHSMTETAHLFDGVLCGRTDPKEAQKRLKNLYPEMPFSNGFYRGREGHVWKAA